MVTVIDTSATLSDVLNYNEKKVAQKDAVLIHASGFLKDANRLNFYEKEERFQRLNELNNRSDANTLHASLNFDPSEHLTDTQLAQIADRYMEGLGMKDQPYLVYRHTDAGHPHVHIVSTLIRPDKKRVKTNNIGKNQSSAIRKAIEKEFSLAPANALQRQAVYQVKPVDVEKVRYGNTQETKKAMRNVLLMANQNYQFTSLPEYNAILRQWNVYADRGTKDSRMYQHRGLTYRVIDQHGKKIGKPIKASSYYFKPTLNNLEKKFTQHQIARADNLDKLRQKIDEVISRGPSTLAEFAAALQEKSIEAVIYHGQADRVFGITFVDNRLRTAAKGSDLGKGYGVTPLLKAIATGQVPSPSVHQHHVATPSIEETPTREITRPEYPHQSLSVPQPLSRLFEFAPTHGQNPQELQQDQDQKKRKRRKL